MLLLPPLLLLVNFLAFTYTVAAWRANAAQNPYFAVTIEPPPLLESYQGYLSGLLRLDLGQLPGARGPVIDMFAAATEATLGLLALAFALSTVIGLILGLAAVRTRPPGAAAWLIPLSTLGLAMPSFFVGSVFIAGMVLYVIYGFGPAPLPFSGYGWDRHLVLPLLVLALRPTMQIAQATSRLLGEELEKQYVVAARSLGHSWHRIRWKSALRNVLAPIILTTAASFRFLLGELILVEWLFNWPGLGRLFASLLVPPQLTSDMGGTLYLDAPWVATIITIFALLFLIAGLVSALLSWAVNPLARHSAGASNE
jgi:ABC-type dipeptide/oligopeptide/nickel transport system permease component